MVETKRPKRSSLVAQILLATRTASPSQAAALKGTKVVIRPTNQSDTSRYDPKTRTIYLKGRPEGRAGLGVLKHEYGHAILQKRLPLTTPQQTAVHHRIMERQGLGVTDTDTSGAAYGRLSDLEGMLAGLRKKVSRRRFPK